MRNFGKMKSCKHHFVQEEIRMKIKKHQGRNRLLCGVLTFLFIFTASGSSCLAKTPAAPDTYTTGDGEEVKVASRFFELFFGKNPILTRIKDSVPTIYGENSSVKNSLIADGASIDGIVENCIRYIQIFRF